jgi:hypothetical protein
MPRILHKLRIDEISAVDRGANDGAKIVLSKRDSEPSRSVFAEIFGKKQPRVARHPPRMRHHHTLDTLAEAKRALLFSPDGFQLMRTKPDASIDELAQHLLEASSASPTNKNEVSMREQFDAVQFAKRVVDDGESPLTEEEATRVIKRYSDAHRLPNESDVAAFARIYSGNDDVGLSFRKMVQLAKGFGHPHVGVIE